MPIFTFRQLFTHWFRIRIWIQFRMEADADSHHRRKYILNVCINNIYIYFLYTYLGGATHTFAGYAGRSCQLATPTLTLTYWVGPAMERYSR